ncbi:hypothetical protein LTS10_011775 [Elasticomyces elasticus]|nr:hypothetical protein LTS10_011775 [Elasticomyces elasticus]
MVRSKSAAAVARNMARLRNHIAVNAATPLSAVVPAVATPAAAPVPPPAPTPPGPAAAPVPSPSPDVEEPAAKRPRLDSGPSDTNLPASRYPDDADYISTAGSSTLATPSSSAAATTHNPAQSYPNGANYISAAGSLTFVTSSSTPTTNCISTERSSTLATPNSTATNFTCDPAPSYPDGASSISAACSPTHITPSSLATPTTFVDSPAHSCPSGDSSISSAGSLKVFTPSLSATATSSACSPTHSRPSGASSISNAGSLTLVTPSSPATATSSACGPIHSHPNGASRISNWALGDLDLSQTLPPPSALPELLADPEEFAQWLDDYDAMDLQSATEDKTTPVQTATTETVECDKGCTVTKLVSSNSNSSSSTETKSASTTPIATVSRNTTFSFGKTSSASAVTPPFDTTTTSFFEISSDTVRTRPVNTTSTLETSVIHSAGRTRTAITLPPIISSPVTPTTTTSGDVTYSYTRPANLTAPTKTSTRTLPIIYTTRNGFVTQVTLPTVVVRSPSAVVSQRYSTSVVPPTSVAVSRPTIITPNDQAYSRPARRTTALRSITSRRPSVPADSIAVSQSTTITTNGQVYPRPARSTSAIRGTTLSYPVDPADSIVVSQPTTITANGQTYPHPSPATFDIPGTTLNSPVGQASTQSGYANGSGNLPHGHPTTVQPYTGGAANVVQGSADAFAAPAPAIMSEDEWKYSQEGKQASYDSEMWEYIWRECGLRPEQCHDGMFVGCSREDHSVKFFASEKGQREGREQILSHRRIAVEKQRGHTRACVPQFDINSKQATSGSQAMKMSRFKCPDCGKAIEANMTFSRWLAAVQLPEGQRWKVALKRLTGAQKPAFECSARCNDYGRIEHCLAGDHLELETIDRNGERKKHHSGNVRCNCPIPCVGVNVRLDRPGRMETIDRR